MEPIKVRFMSGTKLLSHFSEDIMFSINTESKVTESRVNIGILMRREKINEGKQEGK